MTVYSTGLNCSPATLIDRKLHVALCRLDDVAKRATVRIARAHDGVTGLKSVNKLPCDHRLATMQTGRSVSYDP